jgi:GntR family transcriptional regulator, transcriptional repressor for pyruvate dehydrogenase complex
MRASVGRQGRVSETIVHRIKKQISDGRLAAGHKLPAEREMARQFKTSRVSVREAYRSLEELGVLRIRRGADGGAFIAKVDHEPVLRSLALVLGLAKTSHKELTEARMLIEPPIARLAARRARKEDIARLERALAQEEQEAAARAGPFRPTGSQFHRLVAACARNLPLIVLMNALADVTANAASALDVAARARHRLRNCHYHRLIFEAIRRRDEHEAYTIMAEHVGDIQRRVRRSLKRR